MAREFSTVGVVGLGTMGAGIVEVFARNGIDVVAVEVDEAAVEQGRGDPEHSTDRAVAAGKLTEEDQATRCTRRVHLHRRAGRRSPTCHLVIEAVPEHLDLKQEIFAQARRGSCGPDAILATNTSSLSVTEISVATANPKRVVGMHFFNPAPVHAVRRGDPHRRHRRRRRRGRQGALPRGSARPRHRRRPGRVHRQRAAVRLPQPRRRRCSRASTPPARTSTRR